MEVVFLWTLRLKFIIFLQAILMGFVVTMGNLSFPFSLSSIVETFTMNVETILKI